MKTHNKFNQIRMMMSLMNKISQNKFILIDQEEQIVIQQIYVHQIKQLQDAQSINLSTKWTTNLINSLIGSTG